MSHINSSFISHKDTLESDLRSVFAAHGSVSKVQVPTDRNTVSESFSLKFEVSPAITLTRLDIETIHRDDPVVSHL